MSLISLLTGLPPVTAWSLPEFVNQAVLSALKSPARQKVTVGLGGKLSGSRKLGGGICFLMFSLVPYTVIVQPWCSMVESLEKSWSVFRVV